MALVCCLDPEEGCTCEKDKVCGGVHIIYVLCTVHSKVSVGCNIHELGARRTVAVVAEQSSSGPLSSI